MGSRFYWLERKVLLAFAIAVLALALIGAFSVVGLAVAFSLLMGSLVIQDAWGTAKPRGISDRLAAVVESSDDAIISKTLDRIITSRNPAAERLFGYATTEAIGRSMLIVIPPERAHEEVEILERIRSGERIDHFKTRRVREDGTLIGVAVTISPVRDEHGRITGASKIARDITAAEELARRRDRDFLRGPTTKTPTRQRFSLAVHPPRKYSGTAWSCV